MDIWVVSTLSTAAINIHVQACISLVTNGENLFIYLFAIHISLVSLCKYFSHPILTFYFEIILDLHKSYPNSREFLYTCHSGSTVYTF